MSDHAGGLVSTTAIRDIHSTYCLCGEPRNNLLSVPDELLLYLSSILRKEETDPPDCNPEMWRILLGSLQPHWVTPILYGYLRSWERGHHPPAEIMEMMRRDYLIGKVRSVQMDRQLSEILAATENSGIRMLILKGSAFARSIYPDPAMRGGSDLDVLVCPDLVEETEDLFTALGYRCDEKKFAASKNYYHEETFLPDEKKQGRVAVDLHWRCTPSLGFAFAVPADDLFSRAVTVRTDQFSFETLAPADAFLHMALNIVVGHTQSVRLTWIHDIALLADQLSVPEDWATVRDASVPWGARNAVEVALILAEVWTGLALPQGFDDFDLWPSPSGREAAIWSELLKKDESIPSYLKLRLSAMPDRREKIHILSYLAGRTLKNLFR